MGSGSLGTPARLSIHLEQAFGHRLRHLDAVDAGRHDAAGIAGALAGRVEALDFEALVVAAAGYAQYETSAYARAGRRCAHNLNYWRFGDYLGIGAGAHGKLTLPGEDRILRRWKVKHPSAWLAVAGTDAAIGGDEALEPSRRPFDYMLNALRLNEGFALSAFEARTGLPRSAIARALREAAARGWIEEDGARVVPTELGRRFANDAISLFLP